MNWLIQLDVVIFLSVWVENAYKLVLKVQFSGFFLEADVNLTQDRLIIKDKHVFLSFNIVICFIKGCFSYAPSYLEYNEQQTTAAPASVGQSAMSFASQRQRDADLFLHPAHEKNELRNEEPNSFF